ncbi:MAG: hypothetical protein KDA22_00715 [Phycisphaerales bacterium]|nr:hypothetical protein [Phycisphaerales bacterium]
MMNASTYGAIAKRMAWRGFITFFAISIPAIALCAFAADRVATLPNWYRAWLAGTFHADNTRALVFLTFLPPMIGSMLAAMWIWKRCDRRWGCRCPACDRSLTMECDYRKIMISGVCPDCGVRLFDPVCATCGAEMVGSTGTCPECGAAAPSSQDPASSEDAGRP